MPLLNDTLKRRHEILIDGVTHREHGRVALALLVFLASFSAGLVLVWVFSFTASPWAPLFLTVVLAALSGVATYWLINRSREREKSAHVQLERQFKRLEYELPMFEACREVQSETGLQPLDELIRRAEMLRRIAEGTYGLEIIMRPDESALWVSPSVERLCGITPTQCRSTTSILDLIVLETDRNICRQVCKRQLDLVGGVSESFEMRVFGRKNHAPLWLACHVTSMVTDAGERLLRLSAQEIQERKQTEQRLLDTVDALHRSRALSELYLARSTDERLRLTALLDTISIGILFFDRDHRVLYANKAIIKMFGFCIDENLIGMRDVVIQSRVAPILMHPNIYLEHVDAVLSGKDNGKGAELSLKDGRILTEQTVVVGESGARRIGRMWLYEDVTEARRVAEQLIELAERDPLTQLFNRRRFCDDMLLMLADAERSNKRIALLALDLDGFKPVNDEHGHQAGDTILQGIASEVCARVRRNESFYRLGGDEFAVLVRDAEHAEVMELASRLVSAISDMRFSFSDRPIQLSASVGIALYPDHAKHQDALIAAADKAMYSAKQNGRNQFVLGS